jgi:hypothetical protein
MRIIKGIFIVGTKIIKFLLFHYASFKAFIILSSENILAQHYPETKVFTREGKSYLNQYPLFSSWVWFIYTILFPIFIIFSVIMRCISEIGEMQSTEMVNQIIDYFCYLVIIISSILYILRLHKKSIQNIINHTPRLISDRAKVKAKLSTLARTDPKGFSRAWIT